MARDAAARLRQSMLALLVLGLVGVTIELVLLQHYDSVPQIIPFLTIGFALASVIWHIASGSATTVRALQMVMVAMVVAGIVGIVLHYRGSLAFQLDIDPSQSNWSLFTKTIRAKAPPALAPGAMAQLGLLGLAYTWRHPATRV